MCEPTIFSKNNSFEFIESKFDLNIPREMKILLNINIEKVV